MSTTFQPNLDPINWDYLHDLSENNPEFEQELLILFCDDATRCLQELQTALAAQNLETAKAIAHHLKGSASNLRLTEVQTCAIAIEAHLLNNHPGQAKARLAELAQQLQYLQATLRSRFAC